MVAAHRSNGSTVANQQSFDIKRMALYGLLRAERTIAALPRDQPWKPEDTESFDCMHYLGNAAIVNCAETLHIKPNDRIFDIGSGFNATGRYLNKHYGAEVIGVELQPEVHAIGETTTAHNGQKDKVHSIVADFVTAPQSLVADSSADHVISFLCYLHIPDRHSLFARIARTLIPGGQIYIEDFYARKELSKEDAKALDDVVACPYLPSQSGYVADLQDAGFTDIKFLDMSAQWSAFVGARANEYHAKADREPNLDMFYSTVAALFARGNLGGVRIHARHSGS